MESEAHKDLKAQAKEWLQKEFGFSEEQITEEYRVETENHTYFVDVVGIEDQLSVAVECGKLTGNREYTEERLAVLNSRFDTFRHMGFVHTSKSRFSGPVASPPSVESLSESEVEFSATISRTNSEAQQFTIPARVRDHAGISSGDRILAEIISVEKEPAGEEDGA